MRKIFQINSLYIVISIICDCEEGGDCLEHSSAKDFSFDLKDLCMWKSACLYTETAQRKS